MASRTVTVRLPEEKVARLRRIAHEELRTLTDVIEDGVDKVLSDAPESDEDNLTRLAYLVGTFNSGRSERPDFTGILEEKLARRR